MHSMRRMSCGLGTAALCCGLQAHAATFVSTGTPTSSAGSETAFTTAAGVATVLAQKFTLTETVTIESVSIYGVLYDGNPLLGTALAGGFAPGSLNDWKEKLTSQPAPGAAGWHELELIETVTLEAGEHTLALRGDGETGFEWHTVDASTGVNTGARGRGLFPADMGGVLFFESDPDAPIFAVRINGHLPTPGGAALAALAGAGLLRRRR